MSKETVGFIGLGHMGRPMAEHVAAAGHDMVAYDAAGTRERAPAGAAPAESAREIAEAATIIFLSLPTVDAVREVVAGIAENGPRSGAVVVDTSTIGLAPAREMHATLERGGIEYVDAPVSGMALRAREGTLAVMYSGSERTLERIRPMLSTFSNGIHHVGREPGLGQLMKLVNNSLAISSIVATSEAIACGLRGGLEMETMLGVIDASSGQSFVSSRMFPAYMASERFDSGGMATLLEKDVSAFVDAANDLGAAHTVAAAALRTVSAFAALAPEADQSRVYAYIRDGVKRVSGPGSRGGGRIPAAKALFGARRRGVLDQPSGRRPGRPGARIATARKLAPAAGNRWNMAAGARPRGPCRRYAGAGESAGPRTSSRRKG